MKLSYLVIGLGLLFAIPNLFGVMKPASFRVAARQFPRSLSWGYALMALGTLWFLWNVQRETISDFAAYKKMMLAGFGLIGLLACIYVKDFLAVRALAIVLLLLSKLLLDTARWHDSGWRLVIAVWAYLMVIAGIWLTVSPWRLRDFILWETASEQRIRLLSSIRLGFFLFLILLGIAVY